MSFCFGKLGICDSLYSSVHVSSLRDSSLTYTLSSHMPKKNSWFFSLSRFLLVITTEWQLPSSLHMELLTRILSKEANLMFSHSTGHLRRIPSLFYHMRPAEISPSPVSRTLVWFPNNALSGNLLVGFSEGWLCSVFPEIAG